jgi:uncharacterized membrane protein
MRFSTIIPAVWLLTGLGAAALVVAFLAYRRPLVPLGRAQRISLIALRATALFIIAVVLFRPYGLRPPATGRDSVVPVLVDRSQSMTIADAAGGAARFDEALGVVRDRLVPALAGRFSTELFTFGDTLEAGAPSDARADARRTDLTSALDAVHERYRGRAVSAIVIVSDGGDTSRMPVDGDEGGPPIVTVGVGSADLRDREITGVVAGEQHLDESSVDLRVSAVSRGFGRQPFRLQLSANGRALETRTVTPAGDGAPVDVTFTVAPDSVAPTLYTVEIPDSADEVVRENNTRRVLVGPAGRKRRLLAIEGAPGFEHSFLARAWGHDAGLEVDSIVRKGQNDQGENTFFIQAAPDRTAALVKGFPATREDLYAYDAVVIANVESDFFTHAQLEMLADFVAGRGGGLLVMGGRSFSARGFSGTPLEPALPVELTDRRGGLIMPGFAARGTANKLQLTPEGERHPIMRLAPTVDENRAQWAEMPALAGAAALGSPRPGASVLAVTTEDGGALRPLVAVERYGQGRSMIFAGEASWRWRMLLPSTDHRYERFWRQTARWLAGSAADPVSATITETAEPGDLVTVDAVARTRAFEGVADATWTATITPPTGDAKPLSLRPVDAKAGRFTGTARVPEPGLYRVQLEAHDGSTSLGTVDRWVYVGGTNREFADPRLNVALLTRVARLSGGRYVPATDVESIVPDLKAAAPPVGQPEQYELWHQPWVFVLVIGLLAAEWTLRRRAGLR